MILRALTLEDVGPYAGVQRIEFAAPSEERPVTLVGGLNGAGKTTLLTALLHALYGRLAGPLIGRSGRYETWLSGWAYQGAQRAAVTLEIAVPRDGGLRELAVRRSWTVTEGRPREELHISVDGENAPELAGVWAQEVEATLPRGVARLFFFDGERVEALADLERAQETLRTAVGALLGLDLVEQLVLDLGTLRRREGVDAADPLQQARVEELRGALDSAKAAVAEAAHVSARRRRELAQASDDLEQLATRLHKAGGEAYQQRAELEAARRMAAERLAERDVRLRDLAAGAAPLLLVESAVARASARAQAEEQGRQARATHELLERRDTQLLDWLASQHASATLRQQLAQRLLEDRARHAEASVTRVELDVDRSAAERVRALSEGGLNRVADELRHAVSVRSRAAAELDEADRALARVPDAAGIEPLLAERDALELAVARARGALEAADEEVARHERERDRRAARLQRAEENVIREAGRGDDRERIIQHSGRAQETLRELQRRAVRRHLGRIESHISDSLRALLRKDALLTQVEIDPDSFAPRLTDGEGNTVAPDRLSAGERQMVALAILWGLTRSSSRRMPIVIDTPLGRLDAAHRQRVVEHYLPRASHQVVVLSTDTELHEEFRDLLSDHIGQQWLLDVDDASGRTAIRPGYFETVVR